MEPNLNKEISEKIRQYYEATDDNIVGVGYGFKEKNGQITNEKTIIFTVREKKDVSKLPLDKVLPKKIKINDELEIKTDVVQGSYKIALNPTCANEISPPANRQKIRPLKGGISISNYDVLSQYTGTFGFIAIDSNTNSIVGVTNAHVIIDDQFIASDRSGYKQITNVLNHSIVQPNEAANSSISNSIGIVKRYLPITNEGYNYADVALFTLKKEDLDESVSILQEGLDYDFWMPFATTQEINDLLSTDPFLYFSGRTSGARGEVEIKLKINQLGVDAYIDFELQGDPATVDFGDCIQFYAQDSSVSGNPQVYCPINMGDSGSALIADIDGIRKIIGIVFASQIDEDNNIIAGLANRIDRVSNLIQIEHWDGSLDFFESDTENVETVTLYNNDADKFVDISGKRFWQTGLVGEPLPAPDPTPTITLNLPNLSEPLFNKSSFNGVPEPYLSYFNAAADRWSNFIKFNSTVHSFIKNNDSSFNGIYLMPLVSQNSMIPDGLTLFNDPNESTIAYCGVYYYYDLVTNQDSVKFNAASMYLGINQYYANIYSQQDWEDILTHELGHALGIGVFWHPSLASDGAVPPSGHFLDGNSYLNCKDAYRSITNNGQNYTKIPLEDVGGDGTAGGHWENSFRSTSYPDGGGLSYPGFQNELMIGYIASNLKISRLSIGALVDFGYEEVNPGNSEEPINIITSASASASSSLLIKGRLSGCCSKNKKPNKAGTFYL